MFTHIQCLPELHVPHGFIQPGGVLHMILILVNRTDDQKYWIYIFLWVGWNISCEIFSWHLMKIDNPHTCEKYNETEYKSRLTYVELKKNKFNHLESLEMVHLWSFIMVLTHSSKVGHIWMAFKTSSKILFPNQNSIQHGIKNYRYR